MVEIKQLQALGCTVCNAFLLSEVLPVTEASNYLCTYCHWSKHISVCLEEKACFSCTHVTTCKLRS